MSYAVAVRVCKIGGSLKVTLPSAMTKILDIVDGDAVEIQLGVKELVLRKK